MPVFRLLGAADKLQLRTPEGGHDFPVSTRLEAYEFMAKWLVPDSVSRQEQDK
jgi:hypothetical protein